MTILEKNGYYTVNSHQTLDLGRFYALYAQHLLSPVTEISEVAFTRVIS